MWNSTDNVVQGNLIGTDTTGTAVPQDPYINRLALVHIVSNSSHNTIGGTAPGARNVLSGSQRVGILLEGSDNVVEGNFIGTQIDGVSPLGNEEAGIIIGGFFTGGQANNTIGGTASGAGNVIAFNGTSSLFGGVVLCAYPNLCTESAGRERDSRQLHLLEWTFGD